jgi:hypothetical protein
MILWSMIALMTQRLTQPDELSDAHLEVGSTMRARTIARNPSSPGTSNPKRAYALVKTAQSRSADVPATRPPAETTAGAPAGRRHSRPPKQLRFAGPVRDLVHPRRDHRQVPKIQNTLPRRKPLTRRCQ